MMHPHKLLVGFLLLTPFSLPSSAVAVRSAEEHSIATSAPIIFFVEHSSSARASSSSSSAASAGETHTVHVDCPGSDKWHIQVQTQFVNFEKGKSQKACIWARADAPPSAAHEAHAQSGGPVLETTLVIIQAGTWKWVKDKKVTIGSQWTQLCLRLLEPSEPGQQHYWAVNLGFAPAGSTFYFRPWTLEQDQTNLDPAYLDSAPQRIEAERKGDLTIKLLDRSGLPMSPQHVLSLSLTLVQHGYPFGTALNSEWLGGEEKEWYLATTRSMFNAMVPELRFKWTGYEPTKGNFHDSLNILKSPDCLGFAERSKFVLIRGHALEWMVDGFGGAEHFSRQEGCDAYRGYLHQRITRDMGLFAGQFRTYDVWNEILHERAFIDKCNLWDDTIKDAFRWAAAADPTAQLCVNDFGLISEEEDWEPMADLVKSWLAEGVPVHCIGVQAHIGPDIPTERVKYRLDRLAEVGLPLYITEFDLLSGWSGEGGKPHWSGTQQEQADAYQRYTTLFFSHPAVRGIWWWGWWDRLIWIDKGGMYNDDKTPKQAAVTLKHLMAETWNTTLQEDCPPLQLDGAFSWRGFFGTYKYTAHLVDGSTHEGRVTFPYPQPHINDLPSTQSAQAGLSCSSLALDLLPSPCDSTRRTVPVVPSLQPQPSALCDRAAKPNPQAAGAAHSSAGQQGGLLSCVSGVCSMLACRTGS